MPFAPPAALPKHSASDLRAQPRTPCSSDESTTVDNWIFSVSLGVALVGVGAGLMRWHVRSWRSRKQESDLPEKERRFLHSQFRRRMQASGVLFVIGILIPIGDVLIPWKQLPAAVGPLAFILYWAGILLLALWVIVLGIADVIATSAHSRAALGRIRRRQRELENELAELRRRRSNGRDPPSREH